MPREAPAEHRRVTSSSRKEEDRRIAGPSEKASHLGHVKRRRVLRQALYTEREQFRRMREEAVEERGLWSSSSSSFGYVDVRGGGLDRRERERAIAIPEKGEEKERRKRKTVEERRRETRRVVEISAGEGSLGA